LKVDEKDLENTFKAIDTNSDDKISIEENVVAYHLGTIFSKADTNDDGLVSAAELNAWGVTWPEVLRVFKDQNKENVDD